jgi:hypothetical protein
VNDRAAIYTVAVRPSRGKPLPLGDIDGSGTGLQEVLARLLDGFSESSADGSRVALASVAVRDGDDLLAVVRHGVRGVAADIVGPAGAVRYRQTPADLQLVRSGCLFRLPAEATVGALAVHVPNRRGVKGLFEQGLTTRFRTAFPGLGLAIERRAEPGALRDAVAQNEVESIALVLRKPAAVPDAAKWTGTGPGRVELQVTGTRLERTLLQRYLGGDTGAFGQITEFAGVSFDQALVGVRLADGSRRRYDLARPDAGRPLTRELSGIVPDGDGEPTDASLLAALRAALEADAA